MESMSRFTIEIHGSLAPAWLHPHFLYGIQQASIVILVDLSRTLSHSGVESSGSSSPRRPERASDALLTFSFPFTTTDDTQSDKDRFAFGRLQSSGLMPSLPDKTPTLESAILFGDVHESANCMTDKLAGLSGGYAHGNAGFGRYG
jgi:hypothetical protein